ncbi:hypothetical protein IFM89_006190 [Coptis chinensis]|uniref:GDT1 family protein n=1 Tax=Coptis chinensis TaxID=261450 RepID=A0A835HCF7_9MAGN|nr:hypothetical protein IFM89_006190 [Coptis chinensis]
MAMRHPKSIVLYGALSTLVVMMVLSTGLGRIVPNLISRKHTNSAATVLYAFFGLRLLYIAWRSDSKASQKKEMEEALPITFGDRPVYIEEKRTSTRGYQFYEEKNKKAKRIASQFDESCSPQAPRQDGFCGAALGFILSEAIVTNACYCILKIRDCLENHIEICKP